MPLPEILDPQGKAVHLGLDNLDVEGIHDVRIGKHIRIVLEAENRKVAEEKVEMACKKLLANPVMEEYVFTLQQAEEAAV